MKLKISITVTLACLLISGCLPDRTSETPFDKRAWMNADLTGRARADMLRDFLKRHPLKGKTRREVVSLLGEPDRTDKWRSAEMIYVLGNDGSFLPIDHEWLLIDLDGRQRVVSYRRAPD